MSRDISFNDLANSSSSPPTSPTGRRASAFGSISNPFASKNDSLRNIGPESKSKTTSTSSQPTVSGNALRSIGPEGKHLASIPQGSTIPKSDIRSIGPEGKKRLSADYNAGTGPGISGIDKNTLRSIGPDAKKSSSTSTEPPKSPVSKNTLRSMGPGSSSKSTSTGTTATSGGGLEQPTSPGLGRRLSSAIELGGNSSALRAMGPGSKSTSTGTYGDDDITTSKTATNVNTSSANSPKTVNSGLKIGTGTSSEGSPSIAVYNPSPVATTGGAGRVITFDDLAGTAHTVAPTSPDGGRRRSSVAKLFPTTSHGTGTATGTKTESVTSGNEAAPSSPSPASPRRASLFPVLSREKKEPVSNDITFERLAGTAHQDPSPRRASYVPKSPVAKEKELSRVSSRRLSATPAAPPPPKDITFDQLAGVQHAAPPPEAERRRSSIFRVISNTSAGGAAGGATKARSREPSVDASAAGGRDSRRASLFKAISRESHDPKPVSKDITFDQLAGTTLTQTKSGTSATSPRRASFFAAGQKAATSPSKTTTALPSAGTGATASGSGGDQALAPALSTNATSGGGTITFDQLAGTVHKDSTTSPPRRASMFRGLSGGDTKSNTTSPSKSTDPAVQDSNQTSSPSGGRKTSLFPTFGLGGGGDKKEEKAKDVTPSPRNVSFGTSGNNKPEPRSIGLDDLLGNTSQNTPKKSSGFGGMFGGGSAKKGSNQANGLAAAGAGAAGATAVGGATAAAVIAGNSDAKSDNESQFLEGPPPTTSAGVGESIDPEDPLAPAGAGPNGITEPSERLGELRAKEIEQTTRVNSGDDNIVDGVDALNLLDKGKGKAKEIDDSSDIAVVSDKTGIEENNIKENTKMEHDTAGLGTGLSVEDEQSKLRKMAVEKQLQEQERVRAEQQTVEA